MSVEIKINENKGNTAVVDNRHTYFVFLTPSRSLSLSIQFSISISVAKYFIGTIATHNSYTHNA